MKVISQEPLENEFRSFNFSIFTKIQEAERNFYFERVSSSDEGADSQEWPARDISNRAYYFEDFKIPKSQQLYRLFMEEFLTFRRNFLTGSWRLNGCDFLLAVDEFVKKYPAIKLLNCDDWSTCSSYLVVIPRKDEQGYYGTTFVYIPQYGEPVEFFLNPTELNTMIKKLQKIQNIQQKNLRRKPKRRTK